MDRRSEGKSETESAKSRRALRLKRIANGVCVQCGVTPVHNRTICYKCADRLIYNARRSTSRSFFREYDLTPERMCRVLTEVNMNDLPTELLTDYYNMIRAFGELISLNKQSKVQAKKAWKATGDTMRKTLDLARSQLSAYKDVK